MNSPSDKPQQSFIPVDAAEERRLAKLRSYNVLDTERESAYDEIVKLAKYVCDAPIALVSLVENARQWFKAEIGLGISETPISMSVCAHAILQPAVFVVPDLREDPRFANNPLILRDPPLLFYAGAPLITPDGFVIGTVCVLDHKPRSISDEQKNLLVALAHQTMTHLELRRTIAWAASANRYRSRLMAVAGHDLMQPLQVAGMIISTQQLKSQSENDRERFDIALSALRDLKNGLDKLAQDSKIGSEVEAPDLQEFPISEILDHIAATWREHAEHKGLSIRVVDSSAWVRSDPALLTTIVANLVGNAIKYTPAGAVVIGCRRGTHTLCVHVVDTGVGVPEGRQHALFAAFHQEDSKIEGLGLGLAIVQRTAEALGANITMRSRVGKGTNFSVCVPIVANRRAS